MAWGAKTNATQLTSITTEQFFALLVTTTPRELIHCEIEVNFPVSPTDNAIVAVYGTLDAENWDDTPLMEFVIDKGTDPNKISFQIMGVYKFRIGVRRDGTTDTLTSADFSFRRDNVSA